MRYVAMSYQLAGPGGYHPPLARSPLFQRKRAFTSLHCPSYAESPLSFGRRALVRLLLDGIGKGADVLDGDGDGVAGLEVTDAGRGSAVDNVTGF